MADAPMSLGFRLSKRPWYPSVSVFSGVLLDMNLHGMSSILVAQELVRRSVLFVLVTGYGARDSDPPLVQSAPRLQKPFTYDELMRVVRETFAQRP